MKRLVIFLLLAGGCRMTSPGIKVTTSTENNYWFSNDRIVSSIEPAGEITGIIEIDTGNEKQRIDGFGGCFNELGWTALQNLDEAGRQGVIQELFDPENGCRFTICRMPIGANDFAVDWYSHNETDGDFEMADFSVERDRQRLIPYIKKAREIYPDLKLWASPWSPPSWMKKNRHYACRADARVNDLPEDRSFTEELNTLFIMEAPYLKAYALYFSKFLKAYREEGLPVYAVHVQNEPNSAQNFPSCLWHPDDLALFIGRYLGPQFEKDSLDTEIWLGTIERPQIERIEPILNHPEAKKYITGVGFQWAGKDAIAEVHRQYPEMPLMQTETECGNGSNDWAAAEHTFQLMKHYFENGANAYMYWNIILDESSNSTWAWKQNSMITIDSGKREVTYNPEFYLMKHFSHFLEPGAVRLEIKGETSDALAFRNLSTNQIILILHNGSEKTAKRHVRLNGKYYSINLPGKSFNTVMVKTPLPSPLLGGKPGG